MLSAICPNCRYSMIWQNDFDFEDIGYDGEGVVRYYHCDHCGADIEVRIPIEPEK